jgi:DNA-binding protein H-NS
MKLDELLAKKAEIEKQITLVRQRDVGEAIAKIRLMVSEFQLSAKDIFPTLKRKPATASEGSGKKVAAKYQNPETGITWSGRGITPKWLLGKDKADFLIK